MQRQPSHHGLLSLVLADPVAARHFLLGAANSSTGAGSKITISGSAFALLALEPSISTWPLPADVRAVAPSWVGFPRGTGMGGMEVSKSAPQGGCSVHGIPGAVTRRGPGRTKYTVVPTQEPLSRDLAHAGDGQGGGMAWLPGVDGREDSASSIRGCFQGQGRPKGAVSDPAVAPAKSCIVVAREQRHNSGIFSSVVASLAHV